MVSSTMRGSTITKVVLIPPLESDCQVMVFQDDIIEFLQQVGGLIWMQFVDIS